MNVTYQGVTRPHQDWARFCNVSEQTMRWRIAHWGVERAVTTRRDPPRSPMRTGEPTPAVVATIVTAYTQGVSEDAIAGMVNRCRRTVSRWLIEWGKKVPGSHPIRLVGQVAIA